jgi:transposase InsO family protein
MYQAQSLNELSFVTTEKQWKVSWVSEKVVAYGMDILYEHFFRDKRSNFLKTVPLELQHKRPLPDTGAKWRWREQNGEYYYCYERLPKDYQKLINHSIDEIQKGQDKDKLNALETRLKKRVDFLKEDYLNAYNQYEPKKKLALAEAAAWLKAIVDMIETDGISVRKHSFFMDVASLLVKNGVTYLPHNHRRLMEKILLLFRGDTGHTMTKATDVVQLPREGNSNSKQYDDLELLSWITMMRASGNNYTNALIVRQIRLMCDMTAKKMPSTSWFDLHLAKHDHKLITLGRWGDKGRRVGVYTHYNPIENALYAGDCWQMDGTRANFLDWKDSEGKSHFLYMVIVRDVHSGAVLGLSMGESEDRWMYIHALRMAAQKTGYLPYELVLDRFPGHNSSEFKEIELKIKEAGILVNYVHTAQGKAKIERFFNTLQTVFMAQSDKYYGEGIMSNRPFAHRSSEMLKESRKKAKLLSWGFEKACDELEAVMALYNNTPLSNYSEKYKQVAESPMGLHDKSPKESVKVILTWAIMQMFGLQKVVGIRNSYIKTDIQKVEYLYAPPVEVVLGYKEVMIAYDLNDLRVVHVFTPDGRKYLGDAPEQARAQIYGPNANFEVLAQSKQRGKAIREAITAKYDEVVSHARDSSVVDLLMGGLASKAAIEAAETNHLLGDRLQAIGDRAEETGSWDEIEEKRDSDFEGYDPYALENQL